MELKHIGTPACTHAHLLADLGPASTLPLSAVDSSPQTREAEPQEIPFTLILPLILRRTCFLPAPSIEVSSGLEAQCPCQGRRATFRYFNSRLTRGRFLRDHMTCPQTQQLASPPSLFVGLFYSPREHDCHGCPPDLSSRHSCTSGTHQSNSDGMPACPSSSGQGFYTRLTRWNSNPGIPDQRHPVFPARCTGFGSSILGGIFARPPRTQNDTAGPHGFVRADSGR